MKKEKYKGIKKLNLGCGWDKRKGFLNIDIAPEVQPDLVHDMAKGLAFLEDNQIEYIFSSHALEHVKPDGYDFLMRELFRVSKNGAIWEFELPFDNLQTRTNNEHYRTYSWFSFDQYEVDGKRFYYKNAGLKKLGGNPSFFEKLFFNLFPFMRAQIKLKFRVVKKK